MESWAAKHFEIDDRWITDWVEFGFKEIAAYLAQYTRFAVYCQERDDTHI